MNCELNKKHTSAILHGSHEQLHLCFMRGPWCPSGFIHVHKSLNCIVQTLEVCAVVLLEFPRADTLQVRLLKNESLKVSLTCSDVSGRLMGWVKGCLFGFLKNLLE